MSVLDKPKERPKWKLTFGRQAPIMKQGFSQCRTTALTQLKPLILRAQKLYPEEAASLLEVQKTLSDLKMTEGEMEWAITLGGATSRIRIERIEA